VVFWSWVPFPKLCLFGRGSAASNLSSRDYPNEIFGFGQFALFAKTPLLLRAIQDVLAQLVALLLVIIINNSADGAHYHL
jgi:hypothetical protein